MKVVSSFGLGEDALTSKKRFNCILGISVGSRDFSKEHIKKYLEFCLTHFDKVLVIIVDEIKKYNWMAFDKLSEKDALKKAIYEGKEMANAIKKVVKTLHQEKFETEKIKIMHWNEIIPGVPEYNKTVKIFEEYFQVNASFRKDAFLMTDKYAQTRAIKDITALQKEIAVKFLLEELALFILIGKSTKDKYCIDIYPGKFMIMENIFRGKYENLLNKLPKNIKYGHVEINSA